MDIITVDNVSMIGRGLWHGMPAFSDDYSSNCYLIDGGSELALVDVGFATAVPQLLQNVRSLGRDPEKIRKVFLSHAHADHTAGIAELLRHVDAVVYGHALTKETLSGGPGIYRSGFLPVDPASAPVHEVIQEGDVVRVGDVELTVLGLPGHTPDGLGYLISLPSGFSCFAGDTVDGDQPVKSAVTGWMNSVWGSRVSHLRASLSRLLNLGLHSFFPGHGDPQLGQVAVRDSLEHSLDQVHRLLSIHDLDWLIAIDV
jgi:glyoxylase-like metal-dependent hydrolase (beta-lactamase superfamily II)